MNILTKKNLTIISYIFIGLALILSFYLTIQRVNIEKSYDRVEIIHNLTEVQSLANANDLSFVDLLGRLRDKGTTGILVKELSLGDLTRVGKVQFAQGEELKLASYYDKVSQDINLADSNILLAVLDKSLEEQIIKHLEQKISGIKVFKGEITVLQIPVNLPNSDKEKELIYEELDAVGVGFDLDVLRQISDSGLNVIPQIRDWPKPTKESIEFMVQEIKKIPGLSCILFNDKQVPGYPGHMGVWIAELKNEEGKAFAPIGVVEFFNQKGINQLATLMNKETVRVHSIAANEINTYTPQSAIQRYELAVSERNIRVLFVRFFDMNQPGLALEKNLDFLSDLKSTLEREGFEIGEVRQFGSPTYSRIIIGLIGLGVIAGGVLVLAQKNWLRLSVVLGLLGALIWAALLLKEPVLGRKLMALASVIVYPTLAFLMFAGQKARSLIQSIMALCKMSIISLIGAFLMVGLLADKLFMLKLDQFVGVKAAHVLPLVIIPLLLFIINEKPIATIKELLEKAVTYKYAFLAVLAAVALVIYVIRTGNDGTVLVSSFEEKLRSGLKELLGVRPRTKEFLIGHPFTLLILYYGLNKKNWFLILPAIIGQVSLVNTYAHIHTPLIVSLIRSFNGLWIGVMVGIGLIITWELFRKFSGEKLI
ncbi:MAG: DUF2157 domain-containing protein [Clostridia bacterium]|nr:DUF2157 domain-containing protein [Clostridia bacterium]